MHSLVLGGPLQQKSALAALRQLRTATCKAAKGASFASSVAEMTPTTRMTSRPNPPDDFLEDIVLFLGAQCRKSYFPPELFEANVGFGQRVLQFPLRADPSVYEFLFLPYMAAQLVLSANNPKVFANG